MCARNQDNSHLQHVVLGLDEESLYCYTINCLWCLLEDEVQSEWGIGLRDCKVLRIDRENKTADAPVSVNIWGIDQVINMYGTFCKMTGSTHFSAKSSEFPVNECHLSRSCILDTEIPSQKRSIDCGQLIEGTCIYLWFRLRIWS